MGLICKNGISYGGGGSGIFPHLIVISETGSTVTVTKGQTVITATETSTGHFECDLPKFGTWTIDAILGGDDAQVSLVVDAVKIYTVDDSHFHASVTVKYPMGATCRLQSEDETLYATGSPYTFTVHHKETYTITVTYNQRIYTDTVTFTTEGQSFSKTLPSPSQADANDINLWLFFGDVSGSYSSLSDILADSTALSTLMASTDAVDYLVRCKEWITREALVPTMTSNTTPSGVCSASSVRASGNEAYKAFDRDSTTRWESASSPTDEWVQYEFPTACIVKHLHALVSHNTYASYAPSLALTIKGSNDGTNFTNLGTGTAVFSETGNVGVTAVSVDLSFNNSVAYKYYRFNVYTSASCTKLVFDLQFYAEDKITDDQNAMSYIGLNNYCANTLLADEDWLDGIANSEYIESVLNIKVPTMTSNTTPSGEVIYSAQESGFPAYNVFDNDETPTISFWRDRNSANPYVGYHFTSSKKVMAFAYLNGYNNQYPLYLTVKIQGSNDNNTWTDLYDGEEDYFEVNGNKKYHGFVNDTNYGYYRLYVVSWRSGEPPISYMSINTLQFYGREDV